MNSRWRTVGVMFTGAIVACSAALTSVTPAAAIDSNEVSFAVASTHAYVNRAGSLTVDGTLDCSSAIAEAESRIQTQDFSGQPIDFTAGPAYVGINWTATQYVGRRAITAQYSSGIASMCSGGTWQTRYPYPQGTPQWIPGTNGKFTAGPIVIDLSADAGMTINVLEKGTTTVIATYEFNLYGWSENYLRAERVK